MRWTKIFFDETAVESIQAGASDFYRGHPLTISVGIASKLPPQSKDMLMKAADAALYQAKRDSRNRVVVWQSAVAVESPEPS